jgi:hypothetical protein
LQVVFSRGLVAALGNRPDLQHVHERATSLYKKIGLSLSFESRTSRGRRGVLTSDTLGELQSVQLIGCELDLMLDLAFVQFVVALLERVFDLGVHPLWHESTDNFEKEGSVGDAGALILWQVLCDLGKLHHLGVKCFDTELIIK